MVGESVCIPCVRCGKPVPEERVELLKVAICKRCTPQPNPIYGVMEYSHKNTGVLVITDSYEEFLMLKKPANRRR